MGPFAFVAMPACNSTLTAFVNTTTRCDQKNKPRMSLYSSHPSAMTTLTDDIIDHDIASIGYGSHPVISMRKEWELGLA